MMVKTPQLRPCRFPTDDHRLPHERSPIPDAMARILRTSYRCSAWTRQRRLISWIGRRSACRRNTIGQIRKTRRFVQRTHWRHCGNNNSGHLNYPSTVRRVALRRRRCGHVRGAAVSDAHRRACLSDTSWKVHQCVLDDVLSWGYSCGLDDFRYTGTPRQLELEDPHHPPSRIPLRSACLLLGASRISQVRDAQAGLWSRY